MSAKSTLGDIIVNYRQEEKPGDKDSNVELEVRLRGLNFEGFSSIYGWCMKNIPNPKNTQMVSILKAHPQEATNIMEIYYDDDGNRIKGEKLVRKLHIARCINGNFTIAVARESAGTKFNSDSNTILRCKARLSFPIVISNMSWRIDMTMVKEIKGSQIQLLSQIVAEMFKRQHSPETFMSKTAPDYKYEVECEFIGAREIRDSIRPAHLEAVMNKMTEMLGFQETDINSVLQTVAQYIAPVRHLKINSIRRLLPQVKTIVKTEYNMIFPPLNYYLTDKVDGQHALAVIHNKLAVIVSDKLSHPTATDIETDTIIDGELIDATIYAFDVIVCDGRDLSKMPFEERISYMPKAVDCLKRAGIKAEVKAFIKLTNLKTQITEVLEHKRPYAIDGLILVQPGKDYMNTISYKWKPVEHNTIDFLARLVPDTDKKEGKSLYYLFVGIDPTLARTLNIVSCPKYELLFPTTADGYYPIQFAPSGSPMAYIFWSDQTLDNQIVELRCAGHCAAAARGGIPNWELMRIRHDKARDVAAGGYFGNDYRIAEMVWINYIDPFPIEQLINGPDSGYFATEKSESDRAQTALINYAKNYRIQSLKFSKRVVDIATGKGQDLSKYMNADIQNLIAIDSDRPSLTELIRRKYDIAMGRYKSKTRSKAISTNIHILHADINNDPMVVEKIHHLGGIDVDAVICNLAAHYFMKNTETVDNFIKICNGVIKVGGVVSLIIIFGDRIHDLFQTNHIGLNECYDVIENDIRKISIKRMYVSDELEPSGQSIGVLLPFSRGEYYTEFLVNRQYLTQQFLISGFELVSVKNVLDYLDEFEHNTKFRPTDADKQWLGLWGELLFKKIE